MIHLHTMMQVSSSFFRSQLTEKKTRLLETIENSGSLIAPIIFRELLEVISIL